MKDQIEMRRAHEVSKHAEVAGDLVVHQDSQSLLEASQSYLTYVVVLRVFVRIEEVPSGPRFSSFLGGISTLSLTHILL